MGSEGGLLGSRDGDREKERDDRSRSTGGKCVDNIENIL